MFASDHLDAVKPMETSDDFQWQDHMNEQPARRSRSKRTIGAAPIERPPKRKQTLFDASGKYLETEGFIRNQVMGAVTGIMASPDSTALVESTTALRDELEASKNVVQGSDAVQRTDKYKSISKKMESDLEISKAELQKSEKSASAQEQDVWERIRSLSNEISEYQVDATRCVKDVKSLEEQMRDISKSTTHLERENTRLKEQETNLRHQEMAASREYQDLDTKHQKLKKNNRALMLKLAESETDSIAKEKALSDARAQKGESEDCATQLRTDLASLKCAFETAQEEKLHVAAEYKLREVEYKRSLAEEVARVKGLQVEKEQLKASSTDNIQLVAKLQKTESELRRRIRTLQKDDEELGRTLRVAQQEIDSLKGELHQSKTDQSLAEHQIMYLQSNIDAERLDFLSDLKSLLDISSKSPNYLLTQLGISQDVVSSPGHGIFHGCLHPQSIIRGHSFRVLNAGEMQTERGSPVTDAGDSDPFFVAFCQHIVRLCLCMDQTAANDNITLLLWDIWGNLECSTLTNQQISRIANPLASLLSRISRNFSRGILSGLGFWLVGQLASLFSRWGHVDLLNIDGFYDRYKGFEHGEGLLVAAGRHQILHGRQDSQRTRVIAQSVRDGLLGTVERFPDSCRKFRAEIDSSIFNVCMFHLEDDGEDLWVLEAEGGEVMLWHGSSGSCKMIEKGYEVWIHLMRPKPLDTLMVFPHVQMDSQMGRWLCDQYGQKETDGQWVTDLD